MTSLSENTVVTTSGGLVELGYSQITSNVVVSSTNYSSPTTVISPLTIVSDGSPLFIEFYSSHVTPPAGAVDMNFGISLWIDGAQYDKYMAYYEANTIYNQWMPCHVVRRVVLSAGVHTISITAAGSHSGAEISANSAIGIPPTFLRVSKIIQASQFIVPLASAPLVTSLPSAPIDGQEIRYVADATNGIIWNLRYRAASSSVYKWEFIGGPPVQNVITTAESTASTSYVALTTAGPQITIPLSGDYDVLIGSNFSAGANNDIPAAMSYAVGGTAASDADAIWMQTRGPGFYFTSTKVSRKTAITSSTTLAARYKSPSGAGMIFEQRFMRVTPIRVG